MFSGRSDGRYMHKNRTPGYVTSIPGKMKYQYQYKRKKHVEIGCLVQEPVFNDPTRPCDSQTQQIDR